MSREHVGIRYNNFDALRERIQVSSVIPVKFLPEHERVLYVPGTIVPNVENLYSPSRAVLELFLATDATPDNGCVEIIPPSHALIEAVKTAKCAPDYERFGSTKCAPNQLTTTMNRQLGLRQALHFDNHENRPAATRMQSMRRLGCNTGPGSRFLLMGSIDALDMSEEYGGGDPMFIPGSDTIGRYVADGGDMLCAWVRLDPGESWVGPGEIMSHDASTHGQGASEIFFEKHAYAPGVFGSAI